MECCTGIVSSSFLNAWFKTKNTKSVTYIFSSVIASMKIWLTHEVDLSWYFWSFSWYNLHIVQQHERFRSLVCSLVTRHLIRRLSIGNEEIRLLWRITRCLKRVQYKSIWQICHEAIEWQKNGYPFTTGILKNSMVHVFSGLWWIDFCRSERPSVIL